MLSAMAIASMGAEAETVTGPGRDYFNDAAFRKQYRDAAVKIAKRKIASDEKKRKESGVQTSFKVKERISTGGGFSGFFVWDSAFGVLWGRYVDGMPVHGTLDNFYALQQPDGFICREYDGSGRPMWRPNHPGAYNPPILAWAEIELFRSGKSDKARLETVYPKLVKFHACYEKNLKRPEFVLSITKSTAGLIGFGPMNSVPSRSQTNAFFFERSNAILYLHSFLSFLRISES